MKNFEQGGNAKISFPKLEKMSVFHQTHDVATYKPTLSSSLTIRKIKKIPDQKSSSLYQYLASKMDDQDKLYYNKQISEKSIAKKHKYNLEKRVQNLSDVLEILQQLHEEQKCELKNEIQEILMYQAHLLEGYKLYEQKLMKLIELEKQCEEQTTKKLSQFLELQKTSKRSKASTIQNQQLLAVQSLLQNEKQNQSKYYKSIQSSNESQGLRHLDLIDGHQSQILDLPQEKYSVKKCSNEIQEKQTKKFHLQQQLNHLQQQINESQSRQNQLQSDTQLYQLQKKEILSKIKSLEKAKSEINDQIQLLCQSLQHIKSQNTHLQHHLVDLDFMNFLIVTPIQQLYVLKKSLNNQLQQMRGSIRVYCRIRPIKPNQAPMIYELKSHDFIQIKKTLEQKKSENTKTDFKFVFDRIFDQQTSQQQVFCQISQLIQTAIDGVNVCIFTYGQTGSGKTFTMQGGNQKSKQNIGLIPRSTELIFAELQKYKENGWQNALDVSINQIYNDAVVNLLEKSEIKMSKPVFTPTKSINQVEDLFNKAISNRSTAFTLSNADSSRSHLIFIIRIQSKSPVNKQSKTQQRESQLVLVDLAGSERVKESGVSNDRLKEAQHINSSLSQLGQVIRSLKSNKGKTNFRNSKLTYFLEPYLQKGSKAIMFVNISPSVSDESQSINSLKFASTARECKLQAD